jgi:hypothetical protein
MHRQVIRFAIAAFALLFGSPAMAQDSVIINNYVFTCQTMCVVSGSIGNMSVSDIGGGWVRMFVKSGPMPM